MSKKTLFLFLGVSLFALNGVNAAKYKCYKKSDVTHLHPLGKKEQEVGSIVGIQNKTCDDEFKEECKEGCIGIEVK